MNKNLAIEENVTGEPVTYSLYSKIIITQQTNGSGLTEVIFLQGWSKTSASSI
jgi:hypothetical protein